MVIEMKYKTFALFLFLTVILLNGCAREGAQKKEDGETAQQSNSIQQEIVVPVPEGLGGAESFEAYDMDGNVVSSEVFKESKITMVNVWATYCNPCLREMPELGELAQEYEAGEFRLIGIISDVPEYADQEAVDLAKDLIEQTGASYTHLLVNDQLYRGLLKNVTAVPTTYFFDENGILLDTVIGAMDKAAWKEKIDELLEKG